MTGLGSLSASSHIVRSATTRLGERARDAWWRLRRRPLPMVLLQDQRSLTAEQLARAHSIIDWIERVIEARPGYLKQHRLNEEIHFPQAIWALDQGAGLYDGFRAILSRDPRVLNYLRLWSQHFTGYRLFSMEFAKCQPFPHPDEIGAAADRRLAALEAAPDCWVGRYLRLAAKLPPSLRVAPPRQLGEIGWNVGGRTVSYDSYVYLERIAVLHECGVLDRLRQIAAEGRTPSVIEIGGGYGGLAYYLAKLIPQLRIVIVDIPESLIFSSLYLSLSLSNGTHTYARAEEPADTFLSDTPGCSFIPNYLFDGLLDTKSRFDLAINTLSMSEMDAAQVEYYCLGLGQLLSDDALFFEQNQNNTPIGRLDAQTLIARHFGRRQDLRSRLVGSLTQGTAHLWSNDGMSSRSKPPVSNSSGNGSKVTGQSHRRPQSGRVPANSH
jgi:hypothetical protein